MPSPISSIPKKQPEHYFDDAFVGAVRGRLLTLLGAENDSPENSHSSTESLNSKSSPQPFSYEPADLEQLKADDWFIRRFLKWEPTSVEQAVKTMQQVLAWRKRIAINHWSESTFPGEFYQVAACFSYLPDREGHSVIICRLRFNRKDPNGSTAIEELARHYFIYVLERIVRTHPNTGFGLIFDCHRASLSNVDLDMARFIINTLSNYYSGAISYVCIYELPWIFNQIWKLVRSWLDEDARRIVRFATAKDIHQLIEPAHLPDYMGGNGTKCYRFVPKGVPSLEEVAAEKGIRGQREVARLTEHFAKLLQLA